ncbi:MAG: 23S rRNA (adenine(2503)-C(2))-methyltransferase RlmN [Clostridiales bacterium]|nr:23S rRNA (adenine(2503)-C(2))-methyltransferase RlmN [Clostridiales bacterium]
MKTNLGAMELSELEEYFESIGEKKYRARQVFQWIYRGIDSFDEMSDIPATLREKLKESAEISALKVLDCKISQTDGTRKYLFELPDGNMIESVFMKYKFGNSICISSQAGCRMGCVFCASGKNGLSRNLSAGEMAGQILEVQKNAQEKINHIVVMGTGEPFDNYENVSAFMRIVNHEHGLNIGMRNITVSTCGIVPRIKSFANDFPQANLAVSLHAPNDAMRKKIMPIANKYPYDELISACKAYTEKTGRRITFEYTLIAGQNDDGQYADELAAKLQDILCHVNLIPMNPVSELSLAPSAREKAVQFMKRLRKKGIATTIRRELGQDIEAACGQLRLSKFSSLSPCSTQCEHGIIR